MRLLVSEIPVKRAMTGFGKKTVSEIVGSPTIHMKSIEIR